MSPAPMLGLLLLLIAFLIAAFVAVLILTIVRNRSGEASWHDEGSSAKAAPASTALPSPSQASSPLVAGIRAGLRCPYCRTDAAGDDAVACAGCTARHHEACWDEHGECAACRSRERFSTLERTDGRAAHEAPAGAPPLEA